MSQKLLTACQSFLKMSQVKITLAEFNQLKGQIVGGIQGAIRALNLTQAQEIDAVGNKTLEALDDILGKMIDPANAMTMGVMVETYKELAAYVNQCMWYVTSHDAFGQKDPIVDRNGLRQSILNLDVLIEKLGKAAGQFTGR